ncbi:unnamed protein product [marine sediment metagenome]|uniref:Uncharacterized protein n=1 Tax=marine sediment metagenome TaxID=412755 RepID=X0SSY9_9ZZZZ
MIIFNNTTTEIALTLGSEDTLNPPALSFKAIRKNTRKEVLIDPIVLTLNNERWVKFDLDGSLFQVGEHIYQVFTGSTLIEQGILIVKDGTATETDQYHPALEGEKGEHS